MQSGTSGSLEAIYEEEEEEEDEHEEYPTLTTWRCDQSPTQSLPTSFTEPMKYGEQDTPTNSSVAPMNPDREKYSYTFYFVLLE